MGLSYIQILQIHTKFEIEQCENRFDVTNQEEKLMACCFARLLLLTPKQSDLKIVRQEIHIVYFKESIHNSYVKTFRDEPLKVETNVSVPVTTFTRLY